jgi:hypothetical protein
MGRGHDNRLHLPFLPIHDEADEADGLSVTIGHPESFRTYAGEMRVKVQSRIVAADGRIVIDLPVALGQFHPQRPACLQVRRGIWSNRDLIHCPSSFILISKGQRDHVDAEAER